MAKELDKNRYQRNFGGYNWEEKNYNLLFRGNHCHSRIFFFFFYVLDTNGPKIGMLEFNNTCVALDCGTCDMNSTNNCDET